MRGKRLALAIVLLMGACSLQVFANDSLLSLRTRAMGSAGVALSNTHTSMFSNPAALFFRSKDRTTSFYTALGFGDSIVPYSFDSGVAVPFVQNPLLGLDLSFAGKYIALTLQLDNTLTGKTPGTGSARYNAYNNSLIRIDAAYGYKGFALGVFLSGGNHSMRENILLTNENVFIDYFTQTWFQRYSLVPGSEFFNIGLGMQFSLDWFSMGIVTETLVGVTADESLFFSGQAILDTLSVGIGFRTPSYTWDNQLSLCVVEGALDFYHAGDNQTRAFHAGLDLEFQLLPEWSVSVRTGYVENKPLIGQLFSFDASQASQTFGVGAQMGKFNVDMFWSIPIAWYMGIHSNTDAVPWSISLSISV